MISKKLSTVIFDMDGVIFDSEKACLDVWKELAGELGLENIEDVFKSCIGTTSAMCFRILTEAYGGKFDARAFQSEASERFQEKYSGGRLPIMSGVKEILTFLKNNGIRIGIASSTGEATVRREIAEAGLAGYFETITCGDMLRKSKPEPDIYLLACRKMGVVPEETVAVEDSFNGIRSAWSAGLIPVMVPDLIPADGEMYEKAEAVVTDLFEAKLWIEQRINRQNREDGK